MFHTLSAEILLSILHFLEPQDVVAFLSAQRSLSELIDDDEFWHALALTFNVTYRSPNQTWRELCFSGDIKFVCPHLRPQSDSKLLEKRESLWQALVEDHVDVCGCNAVHQCRYHGMCFGKAETRGETLRFPEQRVIDCFEG